MSKLHFDYKSLDELGLISRGRSKHRPRDAAHLYGGKYPFVQTGDIKHAGLYLTQYSQTYSEAGLAQSKLWPAGTLCITIAANIAETTILGIDACFPDSVIGFIANDKLADVHYIKYLFDSQLKRQYQQYSQGVAQDNLSQEKLLSIKFPIPPLPVQRKIAAVLTALDDKIALNKRINDKLEAMAKRLYDYWFVQFDFPDENGRPYKSSGGKMVWNETLKREIPKGWEVANISIVADILPGGTPSKANQNYWNGDIPFFGPTDCSSEIFQLSTAEYITPMGLNNCSSLLYPEKTIIITARGSVGKLIIVGRPMAMNQSCYAIKPKQAKQYAYLYYLTKQLIDILKYKETGSVFKSITTSDIENSSLVIASQKVINHYCQKVSSIFEQIKCNSIEISRLTALRDRLLPLLMNGQVEVELED